MILLDTVCFILLEGQHIVCTAVHTCTTKRQVNMVPSHACINTPSNAQDLLHWQVLLPSSGQVGRKGRMHQVVVLLQLLLAFKGYKAALTCWLTA